MPAPSLTFTDTNNNYLSSLSFANVDAGGSSLPQTILVWNNKGGTGMVSTMTNVTITTVTINGLSTGGGDTITNGQQVVDGLYVNVECPSQGDTSYTPVGGNINNPIGSSSGGQGYILGQIGGDYAQVNIKLVAPTTVTSGPVNFLIRVNYSYQ
jgi:hypothetical protein